MTDKPPRVSRSAFGNGLALFSLVLLACALAAWQKGPWWVGPPPPKQWIFASVSTLLYALLTGTIIWRSRTAHSPQQATPINSKTILVAHASQTGSAIALAERTAHVLRDAGLVVDLRALELLDLPTLAQYRRALFLVSTTGEGDPPDPARRFVQQVMRQTPLLAPLKYAVLALGDASYARYCAFGRQLDQWLHDQGATALFPRVEVNNADEKALRNWQQNLASLSENTEIASWSARPDQQWTLRERRLLNPHSLGGPVYLLTLVSSDSPTNWQAGDLIEVEPRHSADIVETWLQRVGLNGETQVLEGQNALPLAAALASRQLPAQIPLHSDPQQLIESLPRLQQRTYSIASLPVDGTLQIVVRRMCRPDGSPGISSGWLCDNATVGAGIALRIRSNPNFHAPDCQCPMILIGNGTGIAALHAHLAARIAEGAHRNWLIFGERNSEHDFFFGDQIRHWQRQGFIERLDLAFSRDQAQRIYVQQRVNESAAILRTWVTQGAVIYVCGSRNGMAPAVDTALREVLGQDRIEQMRANGRYRRDIY